MAIRDARARPRPGVLDSAARASYTRAVDLRQLEIFAKVAEFGSFSRAAEALYLTQPTVSEHIRTLEDEFGVRLLDRLGRKQITLEELQGEPLLIRERGSGTRVALEAALAEVHMDLSAFRIVGEMGSTQAIKQAVKAGVGVSLMSKRAVEEECKSGVL